MYFRLSKFLLHLTVYFNVRTPQVHTQQSTAYAETLEGQVHIFYTEHDKL
jgi:hypothetical protein